jgi:hypothetical protein
MPYFTLSPVCIASASFTAFSLYVHKKSKNGEVADVSVLFWTQIGGGCHKKKGLQDIIVK